MKQALSRLSNTMTTVLSLVFKTARIQADHKKLTHHILKINKHSVPEKIINEMALCLKEILDYRMFAFVIKTAARADIWLDPGMYRATLEQIVLKDFQIQSPSDLNYLNHCFHPEASGKTVDVNSLVYFDITEENHTFRLYLLPQKSLHTYYDDVVNMILQSCSLALSRQLHIESLKAAAAVDPLTGCYNRREFETQLKRQIANAGRHQNDLSVIMFDLDHFKQINDTHGHPAGDAVLKQVAAVVQNSMRSADILARYGGEEFIAILPETSKAKAIELADRLRMKISNLLIAHNNQTITVTASFGVSELNRHADMEKIIQDADAMLYRAKISGRNTVMPGLMKLVSCPGKTMEKKNRLP